MTGTLLLGLALTLGVLNLGGLAAVYFLSRAGKVRSFESRVYSQLENAASRIERMESQWLEEKMHLTTLADEMVTTADRTTKERKRLYAQERRDTLTSAAVPAPTSEQNVQQLSREEQLRWVRGNLQRH